VFSNCLILDGKSFLTDLVCIRLNHLDRALNRLTAFEAINFKPYRSEPRIGAMKKFTLLWVLMIATGFAGASIALSKPGAAASIASSSGGAVQKTGGQLPFSAPKEMNQGNEKKLLAGPSNDLEAKRVKLIFLLMMSLGRYPTPVY